ncbi:glycosyltransferase family 4 protein [Sulfitobacter sp. F26169L]|uniref:glycosyltransferase family 4 protein n=1 Tax=Sulfitobacter sp. F26169L TaxID=2996015 RepID=UPI002260E4BA|nr:glycosyltransferase family 4 protein [Sulfitobacter sp. F26169L]MCX7567297.1 glycosyltransferase family 4 protein [Sulfitobacter sp. F26169L]
MRLAFYAPLKPPAHPVPSGDRAMARALVAALTHMGAQVDLAATFRSRDGKGDPSVQARLIAEAAELVPEIIEKGQSAGWQAWVTYHSYYKAPDLLGPAVSRALGIPYLAIEATRARKRFGGPWDAFARISEAACDAADVIFYLTARDYEALQAYAPAQQQHVHLRPFLPRNNLPPVAAGENLLAVGMMRVAAKLESYKLIAQTLALLPDDVTLEIAGDGPARSQVEAAMAPLSGRVTFLGAIDETALKSAYAHAGALIWPGVEEAFGMIYLEAQAHGLPVIAQDRPGVRDVLFPRSYPSVDEGAAGLAALARRAAPPADDIRTFIRDHHLLPAAAHTLRAGLAKAGVA